MRIAFGGVKMLSRAPAEQVSCAIGPSPNVNEVRPLSCSCHRSLTADRGGAAARRWHETIWTIELLVREGPLDAEMWTRTHQLVSAARDAFYENARRDLGIAGDPPPSGEWPRPWRAELSG
ncbi:hypothetical protein ACWZEH_35720 (plasmid) [Streptomyces sp. QTS137]